MCLYLVDCVFRVKCMQDVSVKRFRTLMRGRAHLDDSKSYSNAASEILFRNGRERCAKVLSFRRGNRHFVRGRQANRMADYTNAELTRVSRVSPILEIAYEDEDCSGPAAQLLYMERYQARRSGPVIISLQACTRGYLRQIHSKELAGRW